MFKKLFHRANAKRLYVSLVVCIVSIMSTMIACFAEDTATTTAMTTALGGVKSDALAALAVVAPIAIAIMGAFLVWKYGMRFFKSLAK